MTSTPIYDEMLEVVPLDQEEKMVQHAQELQRLLLIHLKKN